MNTLFVQKRFVQKQRRWLVALVIAALLTVTATYVPALTPTAYACQGSGAGC